MTLPPEPPTLNFTATVINGVIHLPPGARLEADARLILIPRPLGLRAGGQPEQKLSGSVVRRSDEHGGTG